MADTLKINPLVALEEAAHLVEFYRNRSLVNAQGKFEVTEQIGELRAKVDMLIAEAEATQPKAPDAVDPVEPEA